MFARRRALVVLATVAIVASGVLWAAPAYAACTSVPGSTPGSDVTVAGQTYRVPAIGNIRVCTDSLSVPGARVETSGGSCLTGCLTVFALGGEADGGGITVSWTEDGSTRSQTVNPGGVGGPSEICVLSVGSPDAPYPACTVAIGPDGIGDPVGDIMQLLSDTIEPACDRVPPQDGIEFCDAPVEWVQTFCAKNPGLCEGDTETITEIVTRVLCNRFPELDGCAQ